MNAANHNPGEMFEYVAASELDAPEFPKVSIVIPVYNTGSFLEESVKSVLTQTYGNLEVIIVDDGSTDGSDLLCDDLAAADSRVRVIHKQNGGLSSARNVGFDASSGEYIYFLDSDDFIAPNAIDVLLGFAIQTDSDITLFDARVVDENGDPLLDVENDATYYRFGTYPAAIRGALMFELMFENGEYYSAVPLCFFKKSAVPCRFQNILHEDMLFTPQALFQAQRVSHYPARLYYRRVRQGSITTTVSTSKNVTGLTMAGIGLLSLSGGNVALHNHIRSIYQSVMQMYLQLSSFEKKKCKDVLKEFRRQIDSVGGSLLLDDAKAVLKWGIDGTPSPLGVLQPFMKKMKRLPSKIEMHANYRRRLVDYMRPHDKKRAFLIGTPVHGNLGDHAIALAEIQFFSERFPDYELIDIEMLFFITHEFSFRQLIDPEDVLIVSGGGWMGNQWFYNEQTIRRIIQSYPNNKIVIFPQTIYYEEGEHTAEQIADAEAIYTSHERLALFLRDIDSYDFALDHHLGEVMYAPDIALALRVPTYSFERFGVLISAREDRERITDEDIWKKITSYLVDKGISYSSFTNNGQAISQERRDSAVERQLMTISQAQLVITDRLHVMIFCALTATPCIALNNSSNKVFGAYHWLEHLDYIKLADDLDDIEHFIDFFTSEQARYSYAPPSFSIIENYLRGMEERD